MSFEPWVDEDKPQFEMPDLETVEPGLQFPWLGFVLIGAWCLLPIFGLGMLVGALIW